MTKLLFDTNIILDVLLNRQPHSECSAEVWALVESAEASGFLSADALTTIYYFLRKEFGTVRSQAIIKKLLEVFTVATIDGDVVQEALRLRFTDFEDAVTAAAASSALCNFIVSRNTKDFRNSPVKALPPEQVLAMFG